VGKPASSDALVVLDDDDRSVHAEKRTPRSAEVIRSRAA
jgi:hypothetical protein